MLKENDAPRRAPKEPESTMPSLGMMLLVYAVLVIFVWYLIYEYDPISVQRLFHWFFGRWV